jgi:phytoene synthase
VVRRLLAQADTLYARAAAGVSALPLGCRPGINAARLLYAAIGQQVARDVPRSLARRTVVPQRRRLALLARAVATPWPAAGELHAPVLAANESLVRAACAAPASPPRGFTFVVDLFMRLEQRDQGARRLPARGALR